MTNITVNPSITQFTNSTLENFTTSSLAAISEITQSVTGAGSPRSGRGGMSLVSIVGLVFASGVLLLFLLLFVINRYHSRRENVAANVEAALEEPLLMQPPRVRNRADHIICRRG